MVVSGGFNIYPREIELVLEQHPAVREACVVGIADEHWGERLRAFVVPAAGQRADSGLAASLGTFCRTRLAGYKVPREIGFIAEVPRNLGGKVLKRELRDPALPCHAIHIHEPKVQYGA
jgi:acyl-CoA synthetase (AMP-forming)/AMP-acid ligase II